MAAWLEGALEGSQERQWRDERGFALAEVLASVLVLVIGILGALGTFTTTNSATLVAQRTEVAAHQAQRELESLRTLSYSELGLNATPLDSTAAACKIDDPCQRVLATPVPSFRVDPSAGGCVAPSCERIVLGGSVSPGPSAVIVGGMSLRVWRYVTYRDDNCGLTCNGTTSSNMKRLTVAVTVDSPPSNPGLGPKKPIWVSTVVVDPNEGPY